MVKRLQQRLVLGAIALALIWLAYLWPYSRTAALTGVAVLLLGHSVFLAMEFVLTYRVSRTDPLRRANAVQCARAWLAESWIAPRVFCWYQPFRSAAIADRLPANGLRGAVLIHGFLCNRGFWSPWLHELRDADHAFVAVNLEPILGSIDDYVGRIDSAIAHVTAATGRPPVLICHSMGGLAARAWLHVSDGTRVHRIVTLGTPHRGTWLARFGRSLNGRQMRMGSEWLKTMGTDAEAVRKVPFTCWYSNCDNIVFPTSNATLDGADNRLAEGRGHVELAFDKTVRQAVLRTLKC